MAKFTKKKANFQTFESTKTNDKYFRIADSMFTSIPWKLSSIYAHEVYLHMKHKYNTSVSKGVKSKDNISLTYTEIKAVMNSRTFTKAIDELIEYGFIELNILGRFSRTCNIYGFSDMWRFYGDENFKIVRRPPRLDKGKKKEDKLKVV